MTTISSNFSPVLPSQSDAANDLSGITARANAQLGSQSSFFNQNLSTNTNFNLASFDKSISSQTISVNEVYDKDSSSSLDMLVNNILSHIGISSD